MSLVFVSGVRNVHEDRSKMYFTNELRNGILHGIDLDS